MSFEQLISIKPITTQEAISITGGLSRTSKMPCKSINIPATSCHMGSKLVHVKGSVCEGCYALDGMYRFPVVKNALERRLSKIYNPKWIFAMSHLIRKDSFFRWHDSGDIQSIMHLSNIMEVASITEFTKHWLPTREYGMVKDYVESGKPVPFNMYVRLSGLMVNGSPPTEFARRLNEYPNVKGFIGVSSVSDEHKVSADNCPAIGQGGKCMECRKCWTTHENVTYQFH